MLRVVLGINLSVFMGFKSSLFVFKAEEIKFRKSQPPALNLNGSHEFSETKSIVSGLHTFSPEPKASRESAIRFEHHAASDHPDHLQIPLGY